MITGKYSAIKVVFRGLWLAAGGLFFAIPVMAGPPSVATVSVALTKDPVSISQVGKTFYATYNVTIKNTSNASVNYKLSVNTAVRSGSNIIANEFANFVEATGPQSDTCLTPNPANRTVVECANIDVSKSTPQTISLTFTTPVVAAQVPDRIRLNWSVTFQNQTPVSGFKDVGLTTVPDSQTTTEFFTTVPTTGGVFFTGFKAPGVNPPVGGVATGGDLYTTTVQIPQIVNLTTASARETQSATNPLPSGCQNYYLNCFATVLEIPNITYPTNAQVPYMTIYLRIDSSQISFSARRLGIDNVPIYYKQDLTVSDVVLPPVPVPFCNGAMPLPGKPCIEKTTAYGSGDDVNPEFRGDWQWEIRAVDNGRFNT